MIDIECEDERGFPDTQRDAIICITCHDSFDNDYTTFLFGGGIMPTGISEKEMAGGLANGCFRKGAHTICSYADEVSCSGHLAHISPAAIPIFSRAGTL